MNKLMSIVLKFGLILGVSAVSARAQGVNVTGPAQAIVNTPTSVSGIPGNSVLQAVPNAQITVCAATGGGIPCSPLVTIYSNAALTIVAPNPFTADLNGNFTFYVPSIAAGYIYSMTGPGIAGQLFAFTAGNGSGPVVGVQISPCPPTPIFTYVTGSQETSFTCQLTANITSSTIAGTFVQGSDAQLIICQDSTGGRTFSFPASFLNTPPIATFANACTAGTWVFCGTIGLGPACPANQWQNTDQGPSGVFQGITNAIYPQNFGVRADTFSVADAVCSNGSNIITSASAHFLTARISVGQTMWLVPGVGQGNSLPSVPKTTILSIDSDTQIHSTANGNALCGSPNFMVWGDDDFPAFHNNVEPVYYAQINCATAFLPAGGMMVSGGVLNKPQQPTCNAGQTIAASGMIGVGITSSVFYPTPDFDPTTCTGAGKVNCFGPNNGVRHDFGIEGGGLSATANPATVFSVLEADSPQYLRDVSCLYWGTSQANMTGFITSFSQFFEGPNIEIANCGAIGPSWGAGANAGPVIGNFFVPASGTLTIASASPGVDFFSNWISASGVNECAANTTGFQHIFGLYTAAGVEGCVTGGHVTYNGTLAAHNQAIAGRAALKLLTGAVAVANNSSFSDPGAGEFAVSVDATSKFTDSCGNTYTGNINVAAGGIFIPCKTATYPSDPSHPTETGTGACATITTSTGHLLTGTLKCTGVTGAATITLNPGITATNGWRCNADDLTTNANLPHQSASTPTTCVLTVASVTTNDVIVFDLTQF